MSKFKDRYTKTTREKVKVKTKDAYGNKTINMHEYNKKSLNYSTVALDSTIFLLLLIIIGFFASYLTTNTLRNHDINFNQLNIEEEITNQYDRFVYNSNTDVRSYRGFTIQRVGGYFVLNGQNDGITNNQNTIKRFLIFTDILNMENVVLKYTYVSGSVGSSTGDIFRVKTSNSTFSTSSFGQDVNFTSSYSVSSTSVYTSKSWNISSFNGSIAFDFDRFTFYNYDYLDNLTFKLELLPSVYENLGTSYLKMDKSTLSIHQSTGSLDETTLISNFNLYKNESYSFAVSLFDGYIDGNLSFYLKDSNNNIVDTLQIHGSKYYDSLVVKGLTTDLTNMSFVVASPSIKLSNTLINVSVERTSLNEEFKIGNYITGSYFDFYNTIMGVGQSIGNFFDFLRVSLVDFFINVWNNVIDFFSLNWLPL